MTWPRAISRHFSNGWPAGEQARSDPSSARRQYPFFRAATGEPGDRLFGVEEEAASDLVRAGNLSCPPSQPQEHSISLAYLYAHAAATRSSH